MINVESRLTEVKNEKYNPKDISDILDIENSTNGFESLTNADFFKNINEDTVSQIKNLIDGVKNNSFQIAVLYGKCGLGKTSTMKRFCDYPGAKSLSGIAVDRFEELLLNNSSNELKIIEEINEITYGENKEYTDFILRFKVEGNDVFYKCNLGNIERYVPVKNTIVLFSTNFEKFFYKNKLQTIFGDDNKFFKILRYERPRQEIIENVYYSSIKKILTGTGDIIQNSKLDLIKKHLGEDKTLWLENFKKLNVSAIEEDLEMLRLSDEGGDFRKVTSLGSKIAKQWVFSI